MLAGWFCASIVLLALLVERMRVSILDQYLDEKYTELDHQVSAYIYNIYIIAEPWFACTFQTGAGSSFRRSALLLYFDTERETTSFHPSLMSRFRVFLITVHVDCVVLFMRANASLV